ncbi:MAG TPA: cation diffusion facilitator family transporter [Chitinophagales bacterium]|nr:cation diffusion facilitator family transporter [Chitinophagales bacterium]
MKNAFYIGIGLNLVFVLIEVIYGFSIDSLSLISDASHNFLDVLSLGLSLFSFWLCKLKPTKNFTYGFKKSGILIALFNASVLLVSIGILLYNAILRFKNPVALQGATMSIIAGVGVVVNGISAYLFLQNKEKDINIKSAYLHLLSDAVLSFGIVIGGIIIYYTNWFIIDPILSIIISIVLFFSIWNLFKTSLRLSLDGIPENMNEEKIRTEILQFSEIKQINKLHIWALSTTENAIVLALLLHENIDIKTAQDLKEKINQALLHENIHHSTIEFVI